MWFIGVEVEQETSAPSPKKNPGSAPAVYTVSLKSFLNREGNTIEGFVRNRVCILGMCVVLLLLYWRQQKVYFLSLSWKVWRAITCKHALCTSVTDCHSKLNSKIRGMMINCRNCLSFAKTSAVCKFTLVAAQGIVGRGSSLVPSLDRTETNMAVLFMRTVFQRQVGFVRRGIFGE